MEEVVDGHTNRQGSGAVWFAGLALGDWRWPGFREVAGRKPRHRPGAGGSTIGESRVGSVRLKADRSPAARPIAGGDVNGTLALITTAGPVPVALSHRHQGPGLRSLPNRSRRIPRGSSSSRPHVSTSGTSSWNITTIRRRSPTRSRRRSRLWLVRHNKRETDDVTGRGLLSTRVDYKRLRQGRSRPRGARPWLSFTHWKKPPASWG